MINKLVLTWILCLGCCFAKVATTGTCTQGSSCEDTCEKYCESLNPEQAIKGPGQCVNGQCECRCVSAN